MGTQLDLPRLVARLDNDHLFSIFVEADAAGDQDMTQALADEIERRSNGPAPTIHEVPAWLAKLLPSAMWHQKPSGGGSEGEG